MKFLKKHWIRISLIACIIIFCLYAASFSHTKKYTRPSFHLDSTTLYSVTKVLDGDTFEVAIDGKQEKVRVLGINTPETVDPRKPVECFGKEASDEMKKTLTGRTVTLQTDPTQDFFDAYGRILAYVHRDDGLFVNEYMVTQGLAHEYTFHVPYQFSKDFKTAQKEAKKYKKGLWGSVCQGKP